MKMSEPMKPGEVWLLDMGLAAKVRPALILTPEPSDAEHALVTVVAHTTASHPQNAWNVAIPKPWLKQGQFNLQQIGTFPTVKLIRRLGTLTDAEFNMIKSRLSERLGL
jgi:mRNA interferase MazF